MKQMDYLDEELVILALRSALGNIDIAAKDLGVSRGQFIDYMARHPAVKEEKLQLKEALLDKAEQMLEKRMENNDTLLMFFLKTQGKHRGYDSSVALTGEGGGAIQVNMNARALIAAMQNGIESAEEEADQSRELLEQLDDFHDSDGS